MAQVIDYLPELRGEEMIYIQQVLAPFDDERARTFAMLYRKRRRDPLLILVLTLIGFVGFAGLQRFFTDQILMGILYLLTAGLCFIGTIVDLVNYQKLALEYNINVAKEAAIMVNR